MPAPNAYGLESVGPDVPPLEPIDQVLVWFTERSSLDEVGASLADLGFNVVEGGPIQYGSDNLGDAAVVSNGATPTPDQLEELASLPFVDFASPMYRDPGSYGSRSWPVSPSTLLVTPGPDGLGNDVDEIAASYGFSRKPPEDETVVPSSHLYVRSDAAAEPSQAMAARQQINDQSSVEYASLDWIVLNPVGVQLTSECLWDCDLDLEMPECSERADGFHVAVIDGGFPDDHPVLSFGERFDAVLGETGTGMPDQYHGVLCAGIIGAEPGSGEPLDSANVMAPGSVIHPIRAYVEGIPDHMAVSWVGAAVDWAAAKGIEVISISMSGFKKGTYPMENAILNAALKDIVIVAGSDNARPGEDASEVGLPAAHSAVIAVGAAIRPGRQGAAMERVTFDVTANHPCSWESHYGDGLDLVGPGLCVTSTDAVGTAGLSDDPSPEGDYSDDFGGTSSATPFVAGVAALIRNAHPTLTRQDVREILCQSADRIGGYAYDRPKEGIDWNREVGHGYINPERAIEAANNHGETVDQPIETPAREAHLRMEESVSDTPCDDIINPSSAPFANCLRPLYSFVGRLSQDEDLLFEFWKEPYKTARQNGVPWHACILLGSGDWAQINKAIDIEKNTAGVAGTGGEGGGPIWLYT